MRGKEREDIVRVRGREVECIAEAVCVNYSFLQITSRRGNVNLGNYPRFYFSLLTGRCERAGMSIIWTTMTRGTERHQKSDLNLSE